MNSILSVRGLCKNYGGFSLRDVTFELPRGYIMGFIGPNGAGKTTTIKAILDVIKNDAGTIKLFDSEDERNEKIGVVMDAPMYVDDWTLADAEKAVSPYYKNWDKRKFGGYMAKFGLDVKKKVKDLSRGMKVKLQIAVAFSHDADLLVLDEPTSGLDPVARDEVCDLLQEFVTDEKKGVLFSTHITSDLEKVADYITFILDGQIMYTGTRDELLEKYVTVKGGRNELTAEQKKIMIGLREHGTGYEGMVEAKDIGKLPKTALAEQISLEEIIVFMNKGARLHD